MRFEFKTVFLLAFLLTLTQPFSNVSCYGNEPISRLQGRRAGLVSVALSPDGSTFTLGQDNEAVPQPYLIRASDGNVYQVSWNLIHPGPKTFSILNESGLPVIPDENVAVELYLALLRWDKLPVSIRSNVRSLTEESIILLKTRLTEPAEIALTNIVFNLAVGATVGILTGGVSLLPAIVDGFTTVGSVSAEMAVLIKAAITAEQAFRIAEKREREFAKSREQITTKLRSGEAVTLDEIKSAYENYLVITPWYSEAKQLADSFYPLPDADSMTDFFNLLPFYSTVKWLVQGFPDAQSNLQALEEFLVQTQESILSNKETEIDAAFGEDIRAQFRDDLNSASFFCTYNLSPSGPIQVPAEGGSFSIQVTTQDGCSWTVSQTDYLADGPYEDISPLSGEGNGFFNIRISANSGAERTVGTLTIGRPPLSINGTKLTLNQSGGNQSVTGDFDGNGVVDVQDFLAFAPQYGKTSSDQGFDARMDLDGNGIIGVGDFLIFVNSFGQQESPSSSGFAPVDQQAFNSLLVGKRLLASTFFIDFESAGRFSEIPTGRGRYTYSNTGPNTGTLIQNYDEGGNCTTQLTFSSTTGGTLGYTCGETSGSENWRISESGGDDHGNTRSGATSLSLGGSRSGWIETGSDVDYFRVQVSEPGMLTVYTTGYLNTQGTLQNSSGSTLASDQDSGEENNFQIVQYVISGTYYITVKGHSSYHTGSYTLHAQFVRDESSVEVYSLYSRSLSVAFSPDGRYIATGDDEGDIGLWEVSSGTNLWWKSLGGEVESVGFSPDGRYIAADGFGSSEPYVVLLDVSSGTEIQRTGVGASGSDAGRVHSVAFSPDGNYVAIGVDLRWAWIWDLNSSEGLNGWGNTYASEVYSVAFSPDGRYLATGDDAGYAILWDVSSWWTDDVNEQYMDTGSTTNSHVLAVAFSPNGRYLATDGYDGSNTSVIIWDVISGARVRWLNAGNVFAIVFRPDGRYLAAGDEDGIITFWRTDGWLREKQIRTGGAVTDLSWSPGGNLISDGKKVYRPLRYCQMLWMGLERILYDYAAILRSPSTNFTPSMTRGMSL